MDLPPYTFLSSGGIRPAVLVSLGASAPVVITRATFKHGVYSMVCQDVHPTLVQCWADGYDVGPTLNQCGMNPWGASQVRTTWTSVNPSQRSSRAFKFYLSNILNECNLSDIGIYLLYQRIYYYKNV